MYKEISISLISQVQFIFITFTPDSQKYMYTLYPKCGYVESITIDKHYNHITNTYDNNYNIEIRNDNNITESLLHDSVGGLYSQDDLGYSYTIFLIE
jgi:hypothetical protein